MLLRREQIEAAQEKRPIRRLSSFDFLTGIDDFSRMGGFRFKEDPDEDFINVSESLRIPPLADIREFNLQELYRRVAFNISIGNSDDHFRNHGFLLTAKGWTLSPAYDMNPMQNEYQSLLIFEDSNKADLNILLGACEDYMINRKTAGKIVSEVIEAMKKWREPASLLGISKREMDMFAGVFDGRCKM